MAKKVRASYRARREHPFDVWRTLMRLRVMDKLQGNSEQFYDMDSIANALYLNWPDLSEPDREIVRLTKLRFTLRFLTSRSWVDEQTERVKLRKYSVYDLDRFEERPPGLWKARASIFSSIYQTKEEVDHATRKAMDSFWGIWIGRKDVKWPR